MSEPADIRSLLIQLADRVGIPQAMETVRVFSAWEQIVGHQIASRCEPVMIKEGVLKVRASSAAWASELRYLAGEIARRVNEELGRELVKEVRVSVGEPAKEQGQKGGFDRARRRRGSKPASGSSEEAKSGRLAAKTRKKQG